jgi:lysophospholipase L1-like esterase
MKLKIAVVIFSTIFSLFFCEWIVRMTGIVRTYTELNYNVYVTPYQLPIPFIKGHLITSTSEFHYEEDMNKIGLRNSEIKMPKPPNTYRIIILGDSFTFGVGVVRKLNWIEKTKEKLKKETKYKSIELINAGQPGADIASARQSYNEVLGALKPDAVIYILNTSDINDFSSRGDDSRYITGIPKPQIEPYWKNSHLLRLVLMRVFRWDWLMHSPEEAQRINSDSLNSVVKVSQKFEKELNDSHVKFMLFYHPYPFEIDNKTSNDEFRSKLRENVKNFVDMNDDFFQQLEKYKITDYSFTNDGHFNAFGYDVFHNIFYKKLTANFSKIK